MDRRRAVIGLIGAAVAFAARGQKSERPYVIGLLANSIPAAELAAPRLSRNPAPRIIEDGLKDLGWVDGRNVRLVWKTVEGNYDRWPQAIDELIRMRADVIVVFADGAAQVALERTKTIPIVLAGMGSVLETKIVGSLQRPGVNLTGMSIDGLNLGAKRLELLKAVAPAVTSVAVLQHSEAPANAPFLTEQTAAAARSLGLEMTSVRFRSLADLPDAFARIVAKRANGLLVGESPHMYYREYQLPIHEFAIKRRIPAMYRILNSVDSGGLMAYAPDILEFYRGAPRYVDKILRGAKAGDTPIQTPAKFEFVINLRTARAMGLAIPSFALARADRVIE